MSLKKLLEFQEIRKEYLALKGAVKKHPQAGQLKELRDSILRARAELEQVQKEKSTLEQQLRKREMECQRLRHKKEELSVKLYGGKINNPKELGNMEQNLEALARDLENEELAYLELAGKADELTAKLVSLKQAYREQKQEYKEQLGIFEQWKQKHLRRMEQLSGRYQQLKQEISPALLQMYMDLRSHHGETVVATVEGGICTGCHMLLSSVLLSEVRQRQALVQCENCGRILYYEEQMI